ncbi:MAG: hypothetical protein WC476_00880 [Phycisphaerae bacterium]|jgi:hypothetical protein
MFRSYPRESTIEFYKNNKRIARVKIKSVRGPTSILRTGEITKPGSIELSKWDILKVKLLKLRNKNLTFRISSDTNVANGKILEFPKEEKCEG